MVEGIATARSDAATMIRTWDMGAGVGATGAGWGEEGEGDVQGSIRIDSVPMNPPSAYTLSDFSGPDTMLALGRDSYGVATTLPSPSASRFCAGTGRGRARSGRGGVGVMGPARPRVGRRCRAGPRPWPWFCEGAATWRCALPLLESLSIRQFGPACAGADRH